MSNATTTTTFRATGSSKTEPSGCKFPAKLFFDVDSLPKLDRLQAGHLRHFYNQAAQRDGQWDHMGEQIAGQEWTTAFRYQISHMFYGAALAHFHRLPAARSMFKDLLHKLIHKMLLPHVWGYWYLTSQSGIRVDPDIKELRKPWADPIIRENIMYSGHLLLMIAQYSMLFDDDSFDQPGALTFNHSPIFWGMGPEKFEYTRSTLQHAIVAEMERNAWLGVCCEPNCIFVICNQFPLVAIGYNDQRQKTNDFSDVIAKYTAAWKEKGMVDQHGFIIDWLAVRQESKISRSSFGTTSWTGAFMNAWNSEFVRREYEDKKIGFVTRTKKNSITIQPAFVALNIRSQLTAGSITLEDTLSTEIARRAWKEARETGNTGRIGKIPMTEPVFGYAVLLASEMGDAELLQGMIRHQEHYNPRQWSKGGLYYAVNEAGGNPYNTEDEWVVMDAFAGNAAIGYARLNVEDGQKIMFERQWTREVHEEKPYIDGFTLADGVDILRASWEGEHRAMVMTFRTWDGQRRSLDVQIHNLPSGSWGRYDQGKLVSQHDRTDGAINLPISVGAIETTIVVVVNDPTRPFKPDEANMGQGSIMSRVLYLVGGRK